MSKKKRAWIILRNFIEQKKADARAHIRLEEEEKNGLVWQFPSESNQSKPSLPVDECDDSCAMIHDDSFSIDEILNQYERTKQPVYPERSVS